MGPGTLDGEPEAEESKKCMLILIDGARITGSFLSPTHPHDARVIDQLNAADRFFAFATTDGILFVRTLHVVRAIGNTD